MLMVSCGGVVICRGKALLLYKRQNEKYAGWVLPKGKTETGESHVATALREVAEEAGAQAKVVKSIGMTQYSFQIPQSRINKIVYWFLMTTDSYHCKPQAEEFFYDAGFYKRHEAFHLLKYRDEKEILSRAFDEYQKVWRINKRKGNEEHVPITT